MSNLCATSGDQPGGASRRGHSAWLIVCAAVLIAVLAIAFVSRLSLDTQPVAKPMSHLASAPSAQQAESLGEAKASAGDAAARRRGQVQLVDDDGETLWVSPTSGPRLDLSYLPPGCQVVIALRWRQLSLRPEDFKALVPLLPIDERLHDVLERGVEETQPGESVGLSSMLVGMLVDQDGDRSTTCVVYHENPLTEEQFKWFAGIDSGAGHGEHNGRRYWLIDDMAFYFSDPPHDDRYVIAPKSLITGIIDLEGEPPPLRRDMERLVAHTDSDRTITILFAPNSLFGEGQALLKDELAALRDPLYWFLGDELSAAALSMHWDENFFIELLATPTVDTSAEHTSQILADRVSQIPELVNAYVSRIDAHPFGRAVVERFPAMARQVARYARHGFEQDHSVLRCYLPLAAGQNLLVGTDLLLAEELRASDAVATPGPAPDALTSKSVGERLRKVTSLRFARDTLEAALEQLAQEVGVEIVIRGADLQAEGITKNQSFAIDEMNQPAEAILIEILRLANPDKTTSGPDDARQKLVYVVGTPGRGGQEQIVVTTRSAARERGESLPAVFTPKGP